MAAKLKSRKLRHITLLRLGACKSQRKAFRDHFGVSLMVTVGQCVRVAKVFSWGWASVKLLTPGGALAWRAANSKALEVHREQIAPTRETWLAAVRIGGIGEPHREWTVYMRARKKADLVLQRAGAKAFAQLYISEGAA